MANLLPQHIKEDLRKEYSRRFVIVSLMLLSCVLFVAVVSLSPTYIVLNAKKNALNEFKDSLKIGKEDSTMSVMSEMKKEVELLKEDTYSRDIPYNIFATLFETKTEDTTITRISFSQKDNRLNVKGVSATRNSLKEFIDLIGEEEMFLPIENFPYSGFSESTNLPFGFSIKLAENYDK